MQTFRFPYESKESRRVEEWRLSHPHVGALQTSKDTSLATHPAVRSVCCILRAQWYGAKLAILRQRPDSHLTCLPIDCQRLQPCCWPFKYRFTAIRSLELAAELQVDILDGSYAYASCG